MKNFILIIVLSLIFITNYSIANTTNIKIEGNKYIDDEVILSILEESPNDFQMKI